MPAPLLISVLPKSNNTTGSAPTTGTTQVGELALNTFDGVLYTQTNQSGTKAIVTLGGPVTLTGDVTGTGRPGASFATTLKNTGTAGTYTKVSTDAQGRITSGGALGSGDVTTALTYTPENPANKGVANGYASLDSGGKLSAAQIPASLLGALVYQGTWNAATNSPTLSSGTGTKGFYYKISVAGTTSIDGISVWNVGDTIVFDGVVWDKIDGEVNVVQSVAGKTGIVTLVTTDLTDVSATAPTNGYALLWNSGTSKWTPGSVSAGVGTVTSVSSADTQITVSGGTGAAVLQLNPANMNLAAIGGSVTASQIAPSGTNGFILQTVAGAAAWTAIASLGLGFTGSPLMDGTAAAGTAGTYSRGDHVHPSDTTKANLASPTLTGTPLAPTAAANTNSTQIATTAFVAGQAGSATPLIDGTAATGSSLQYARQDHVHPTDTSRASVASPTFTGTVTIPSGAAISGYAPLASPTLTGVPLAPTAAANTATTQLATTAFVTGQAGTATPLIDGSPTVGTSLLFARQDHVHPTDTTRAAIASPAFSGTPTAPTVATSDSSTSLATTAWVNNLLATANGGTY